MKENIKKLFDKIVETNPENSVHDEVDNMKSEYVYDWEDEFDSLDDAYEEQGRGEAESSVILEMIKTNVGITLMMDDQSDLFEALAEHYYLNTN